MSHLVRIAALLAIFATAGCISDADVVQPSSVAPQSQYAPVYGEMHAAIPTPRTSSNVFEYN